MKKDINNCDCCGEDLATAHTVCKTLKLFLLIEVKTTTYFRLVILNVMIVETFSN